MTREVIPAEFERVQSAFARDIPAVFDASARWIWDNGEPSPRNAWRCFRQTFTLPEAPTSARLQITADTRYVVTVNGRRVGTGPVRGFAHRWMVDTWDITSNLQPGENVIGVLVLHFGVSTFVDVGNRGGLLAQVTIKSNAADLTLVTNDTWRVTTPPGYDPRSNRMSCQLGFVEHIDARHLDDRWTFPGFDDGEWQSASEICAAGAGAWPNLVLRDIPPLAEQPVYPTHVERLANVRPFAQTWTIDLRNHLDPASAQHANHIAYAGYVLSMIRVSAPTTVTVAIPWSRFNGLGIDGSWSDRLDLPVGPASQRSLTKHLEPGDHLLAIEVERADHGDGFQVAFDTSESGAATLVSPTVESQATPFATIRCGISGRPTTGYAPEQPHIEPTIRDQVRQATTTAELSSLDLESVPEPLVSPLDLFTLCTQPRSRTEIPVPAALQAMASGQPVTIPSFDDGDTELIVDLGREFSGYISFSIEAPAGVAIDIYGFEYLRGDHAEFTDRLDNSLRYVTREGRQTYTTPTRRGMRWLMLVVRNAPVNREPVILHDLHVIESHYPVSRVGRFRCSNARLEQIHELARRTVIACMEDTYVDCPAYEQTYWVGDAYNSARFATYLFGAEALTERCVRLVPASVGQTPYFASQVPSGWVNVIPNWTFFWTMMTHHHWYRTGDSSFASELWPAVKVALDHFRAHLNDAGLLEISAWNLLDWAPIDQPNEGVVTHQNMLMVVALDQAAILASVAGDDAGASQYRSAADALRMAINEHLWSPEDGGYIDSIHSDGQRSTTLSIHSQMLALLADVATGDRAERCAAVLVDPPAGWVRIGSPWMSAFLYDVLAMQGRANEALDDILLNYGMMLDHDATTCWEVYPSSPINEQGAQLSRSHCHAWSAAPAGFLPAWVLGVRPSAPGWHAVLVAPDPCGLEWAEGSVPLPTAGRVDVSWRIDAAGEFRLEVNAPDDVIIEARLPDGYAGQILVNGLEA